MSRRGWALFAAMCVIWGIPYLLIKVAVRDLSPATLVFLRTTTGAALLVPIAALRGELRPLLPRWRLLLVYTTVEIALPWVLLSDAETRLSSSLSGLLIAAVPLMAAVLATLAGRDRLDARRVAGLLIGVAGVAALLGVDVGGGDWRAAGEIALVDAGYAVGSLMIGMQLSNLPAMGVVAGSLLVTAVAYAPVGLTHLPQGMPPANVLAAVAALGVICTALAFLVYFALIAEAGPVRATVITYVNPAVAVLLGVALLSDRFTAGTAVGFVLIIAGSLLATRRQPEERAATLQAPAVSPPTPPEPRTPPHPHAPASPAPPRRAR